MNNIVVTNDDGIDAPGIKALQKAIACATVAVIDSRGLVIAPLEHHSGCGHQVTTHKPIRYQARSPLEYAIEGTPTDCTRLALAHFCPNATAVISGINAGGNLGVDVYISGTVAAVREAAIHGVRGIAISQYIKKGLAIDWNLSAKLTTLVLEDLLHRPIEPGTFWNVNLPHLTAEATPPAMIFCPPSTQPLPLKYHQEGDYFSYAGEYGKRERDPGTDVDVCFSDNIAVTQLHIY